MASGYRSHRPSAGSPTGTIRNLVDKDGKRRPNQTIGAEPQYRLTPQWTASVQPPPRRVSTATCSRGLIDNSRRFARARSRRSVTVSQTTGNGNTCGAGPLPGTTSRYLVRSTINDQYLQFGSDGSSPPKRMDHRSPPRHSGGRWRGTNRHSGNLLVGPGRAWKPTADGLSSSPETRLVISRPPQPKKHTPISSGKGT